MPLNIGGKVPFQLRKRIKDKYGEDYQVAVIGPGGENLVPFASINHDYGRQAGRGGVGAVMGSKKLKAIVVHGTKAIPVADPGRVQESRTGFIQSLQTG